MLVARMDWYEQWVHWVLDQLASDKVAGTDQLLLVIAVQVDLKAIYVRCSRKAFRKTYDFSCLFR